LFYQVNHLKQIKMKLFTAIIVIAIWIYLTIYLPLKLNDFSLWLVGYFITMIYFNITKVSKFIVWNFYSVEQE